MKNLINYFYQIPIDSCTVNILKCIDKTPIIQKSLNDKITYKIYQKKFTI